MVQDKPVVRSRSDGAASGWSTATVEATLSLDVWKLCTKCVMTRALRCGETISPGSAGDSSIFLVMKIDTFDPAKVQE